MMRKNDLIASILVISCQSFTPKGARTGWNLKTGQQLCTPSIFVETFVYPIEK